MSRTPGESEAAMGRQQAEDYTAYLRCCCDDLRGQLHEALKREAALKDECEKLSKRLEELSK